MRKLLTCTVLIVLFALSVSSLQAQSADDQETYRCDATLITLLLVAVNDYGYQPPLPLDRYALGPYSDERISTEPDAPTVREQTEARLSEAAQAVEEEGFPGIAREIAELSDEVGAVAEAGESLLEAGQAALEAGREALEGTEEPEEMSLGAVPGEAEACTQLRENLVSFFFIRLTSAASITESD